MRKKSGFTFVEQAIVLVPEFEMVVHKLEQQVTLRGQSRSTLQNYIRRIALFVIHFGKLPEKIDPEEINEYLLNKTRIAVPVSAIPSGLSNLCAAWISARIGPSTPA